VNSLGVQSGIGMGMGLLGYEYLWVGNGIGLMASAFFSLCAEIRDGVFVRLKSLRCDYFACVLQASL